MAGNAESRLVEARPETAWVLPAPDDLVLPLDGDPAALAVSRESVRLAFVAALQHLAPRPRAVLILRDVLGWRAAEVALLLDTSVDAVNSALRRARAVVGPIDRDTVPRHADADGDVLAAYVDAFERYDVDALVRLLRDDAIVEMPPFDLWLQGRDAIREWLVAVDALRDHHLTPVEANGSPAAAVYVPREPGGSLTAFAIHVLDVVDGRIWAIHSYIDPELFELFGLPPELPASR